MSLRGAPGRVAVLMGGPSTEREVSLRSGAAVAGGLRAAGIEAVEVDVRSEALDLPVGTEAVFIALHGRFGEDGGVQALLDARGIPYTGSGAEASRAAMDKAVTRARLQAAGLPVPPGVVLTRPAAAPPLACPLIVKPLCQGSSLGCRVVTHPDAWPAAQEEAWRYDGAIVVERFIEGRELTVGILGDRALPAIEIRAPGDRYDYTAKYTAGRTAYLVPAPLDPATACEAGRLAGAVFRALGARGFGRVDFRMDRDGRLFVLELNTIPGFTETSLLPKAAAAAGLAFPELCVRILSHALCG